MGMQETLTIEFDGGSRGNPGPAGLGVVVRAADGTPLVTLGRYIGRATNNVAEYKALIAGLESAKKLGASRVAVRGDSQLVIKQMRGEYRVKHPDMKPLYAAARDLADGFEAATFTHNLRHKNELADKLANLAMDRRGEVTEADEPAGRHEEAAMIEATPSAKASKPVATAQASKPVATAQASNTTQRAQASNTTPTVEAWNTTPTVEASPTRYGCKRCGCEIDVRRAGSSAGNRTFVCRCGSAMDKR